MSADYQVALRHRTEGRELFAWFTYDGRAMTADSAQRLIDGMTPMLPALSKPDCAFQLVAEPIRAGAR